MTDFFGFVREHVPWLAPIVVFGLVVFVHELGHFLAAKLTGVYAPRFSIGFGPALWHRRWGETEYRLGALPLGGYVRMASRDDDSGETSAPPETPGPDWDPTAMIPFGPRPIPANRWFESKPLPARLLIMIAGITMNIVLAVVCMTGAIAYYGKPGVPLAVVDSVRVNSPAAQAGMVRGDSLVAIDGTPIHTAADAQDRLRPAAGRPVSLAIMRHNIQQIITVTPAAATDTDPQTHVVRTIGRVGVIFRAGPRLPVPFTQAVGSGVGATVETPRSMAVLS